MATIELNGIYKIFKEATVETVALRGADFSVESGDSVAVSGRSGSGKSTLVSIVAGLARPSAGTVRVDGMDISALDEKDRTAFRLRTVGIVYQEFNLIPYLSARENVMLPLQLAGRRNASARASELLRSIGLANRERHKPAELSGGERQRVAVAVAAANEPRILIADEPTGELDAENSAALMDLLLEMNLHGGTTLVIVTHNEAVAARAKRRVFMDDGRITREGAARHG